MPNLPSSLAQKYIRIKRIKVNAKGSDRGYNLGAGDTVQMYINDEFFTDKRNGGENPNHEGFKTAGAKLNIIYEDDNIMLINKPAGILCHSDSGYEHGTIIANVQAYLRSSGQWLWQRENSFAPALCNRIDRNTSGIVIAAKNAQTLRIINEKIKLHEVDKYYLAAAHGILNPQSAVLEGYLFKDAALNRVYITKKSQPGSKTAIMEYKTLKSRNPKGNQGALSLLECRLITGRTHQIRAQLSNIGHPILGDGKYGRGNLDKPFGEKKQALCSYKVVFSFKTDASTLSYLKDKAFEIKDAPFAEKYFNDDC